MKFPKIKIRKGAGIRLLASAALSFGAAFFGYYSYKQGLEEEWEYLTGKADEKGNTFFTDLAAAEDRDRYLMFGKEKSSELWKNAQEIANNDQESND